MSKFTDAFIAALEKKNDKLEEALSRQCDNMAFAINHADLYSYYDTFKNELEEDRKLLNVPLKGVGNDNIR